MPRQYKVDPEKWKSVRWGRPAKEIAEELGVGEAMVWDWAHRLGKPVVRVARGPTPRVDWSQEDWRNQTNKELAQKHGCTPKWVNRMRKKYAPSTVALHLNVKI